MTDHMTIVETAVRQVQSAGAATLYEQAMLATQVAIAKELRLLRLAVVASTKAHGEYLGEWMQRIDSQMAAFIGDADEEEEEFPSAMTQGGEYDHA